MKFIDFKGGQFLNEQLSSDTLKSEPIAGPSANQPALIKQQSALTHEVDPNLSSKIDTIKQQNDNLFMCKFLHSPKWSLFNVK